MLCYHNICQNSQTFMQKCTAFSKDEQIPQSFCWAGPTEFFSCRFQNNFVSSTKQNFSSYLEQFLGEETIRFWALPGSYKYKFLLMINDQLILAMVPESIFWKWLNIFWFQIHVIVNLRTELWRFCYFQTHNVLCFCLIYWVVCLLWNVSIFVCMLGCW